MKERKKMRKECRVSDKGNEKSEKKKKFEKKIQIPRQKSKTLFIWKCRFSVAKREQIVLL